MNGSPSASVVVLVRFRRRRRFDIGSRLFECRLCGSFRICARLEIMNRPAETVVVLARYFRLQLREWDFQVLRHMKGGDKLPFSLEALSRIRQGHTGGQERLESGHQLRIILDTRDEVCRLGRRRG